MVSPFCVQDNVYNGIVYMHIVHTRLSRLSDSARCFFIVISLFSTVADIAYFVFLKFDFLLQIVYASCSV